MCENRSDLRPKQPLINISPEAHVCMCVYKGGCKCFICRSARKTEREETPWCRCAREPVRLFPPPFFHFFLHFSEMKVGRDDGM